MRLAKLAATLAVISAGAWVSTDRNAHASEWGCEVLLCATSSNPSWRGVPACHPPMERLISAMSGWGFTWPTCSEAGTGKPGHERYADCPEGWSIGYGDGDHGGNGEPNRCVQTRDTCGSGYRGREQCRQTDSIARPRRDEPYYFDISNEDGQTTRHWFSLQD